MKALNVAWVFIVAALAGCSPANITRGGTLLIGLTQYNGDMQSMNNNVSRWPDRQRTAGTLKLVITETTGGSPEFYRLVDLDLRKREFAVTIREANLSPDRLREMQDELVAIDEAIAALKPAVKTQLSAMVLYDPGDHIESVATLGLLGLALDSFSTGGANRGTPSPSTKVGEYLVTDLGTFSMVRSPEGQNFRCNVFSVPEEGGGTKCEPVK